MARKFKQMVGGRGGWCEWILPHPKKNYLMKCCDCGLVHEVQFRAVAEHHQKRNTFQITVLPWPIRVKFRARRQRR